VFVLIVETAFLFVLWRRSLAVVLLTCIIAFHLGVFFMYGYFFWTWILLNASLLILLLRDWRTQKITVFGWPQLILSFAIITFASLWANPSHLGWYDTRMTYNYRYEAIGESGTKYTIPPRFFEPYGDVFTMSNFSYIVKDHGILVSPYGITGNRERAEKTQEARTPEEIFALESEIGLKKHDPARTEKFYAFVTRYISNWNVNHEKAVDFGPLQPPAQFWSTGRGKLFNGQEAIREVVVKEVTTFYDEKKLYVIRELDIRISGSGDAYYKGKPAVSTKINGTGKVVDKN